MSKRLMLILGVFCVLVIVVGCVGLNWNTDPTSNTPGENTPNNSTTNDNSSIQGDTTNNTTDVVNPDDNADQTDNTDQQSNSTNYDPYHDDPSDYVWNSSAVITITLNTNSITVSPPEGVRVNGTTVTILHAATYNISGILQNGQVVVDTNDEEPVRLILSGATISCATSAPILVEDAEKTIIVLADDTQNTLTDSANNQNDAALLSRDDLTIYGNGSLTVVGNHNDGLRSNDGLIIKSGVITVTSVDDGIFGKDYLVIEDGDFTVNSVGDGIKSETDLNETLGYITIEGGNIHVTSTRGDAITAQTTLLINGGTFTLTSGGGSSATLSDTISSKGLKAGLNLTIVDGDFTINSCDDAIHSNGGAIIYDGTFSLASGDDGIHTEIYLEINDGTFDIWKSYEGVESTIITINGGYIDVTASDDGLNSAGESNSTTTIPTGGGGWFPGGGGGFPGEAVEEAYIFIHGGVIIIDSGGDGIDTGGHIEMSDGLVIINGPVPDSFPNGAIDYASGTFKMTGGILVGVGSNDMPQAPSPDISTQYSVLVRFRSEKTASTLINIQTASGQTVMTFRPTKAYQSIVFSSPQLSTGQYKVFVGGTTTGTSDHGLYTGGVYTPGSEVLTFTISSMTTTVQEQSSWPSWP